MNPHAPITLSAAYKAEGLLPGWPPRNRTERYLLIRQAPSTSWVAASGRWRSRSPALARPAGFKPAAAPRQLHLPERMTEDPTPCACALIPLRTGGRLHGSLIIHGGRRRTRIPDGYPPHPVSGRGPASRWLHLPSLSGPARCRGVFPGSPTSGGRPEVNHQPWLSPGSPCRFPADLSGSGHSGERSSRSPRTAGAHSLAARPGTLAGSLSMEQRTGTGEPSGTRRPGRS